MKVLYEDNHIIVVIKEPNIPSQSDKTGDIDLLTLVKNYIKEKYNKPGEAYIGLVHRLDRPVGGIMVFARTSKAAERLSKQIQDKKFDKRYYAIYIIIPVIFLLGLFVMFHPEFNIYDLTIEFEARIKDFGLVLWNNNN